MCRGLYNGTAGALGPEGGSSGTFTMNADFESSTASIAASLGGDNGNHFFSANNMKIVGSDGSFSTNSALIGTTGTNSVSASIKGYFAGDNAAGVHGQVYQNSSAIGDYHAVFYGKR